VRCGLWKDLALAGTFLDLLVLLVVEFNLGLPEVPYTTRGPGDPEEAPATTYTCVKIVEGGNYFLPRTWVGTIHLDAAALDPPATPMVRGLDHPPDRSICLSMCRAPPSQRFTCHMSSNDMDIVTGSPRTSVDGMICKRSQFIVER